MQKMINYLVNSWPSAPVRKSAAFDLRNLAYKLAKYQQNENSPKHKNLKLMWLAQKFFLIARRKVPTPSIPISHLGNQSSLLRTVYPIINFDTLILFTSDKQTNQRDWMREMINHYIDIIYTCTRKGAEKKYSKKKNHRNIEKKNMRIEKVHINKLPRIRVKGNWVFSSKYNEAAFYTLKVIILEKKKKRGRAIFYFDVDRLQKEYTNNG